jgi:hypothetical protein
MEASGHYADSGLLDTLGFTIDWCYKRGSSAYIWRKSFSILAKVVKVSNVAHEPLVLILH